MRRGIMTEVPLIDLAPAHGGTRAARERVAGAIDTACREIGFFAITGHGVPDRIVDELRGTAHEFFAQPLARKRKSRHPVAGTNRGYHAAGGEALSHANDATAPPDLKEFFHVGPVDTTADTYYTGPLGRQHFVGNIWPATPTGLERAATVYYRAMDRLIVFLMRHRHQRHLRPGADPPLLSEREARARPRGGRPQQSHPAPAVTGGAARRRRRSR
jgi:isopenicillin N synthase-like dioxygenase